MTKLVLLLFAVGIFLYLKNIWGKNKWQKPKETFSPKWRIIFAKKVAFYNTLSEEEKKRFEFKTQEFLLNCRITGINVEVTDTDKILVAASAIIPIFEFPQWRYTNIYEVLLYPAMFNEKFETTGDDRNIMGMVGTGYMEGKMILSKPALHLGFSNESDMKNTAIHEFVHLIDKSDGTIDGVPELLLQKQYAIPWLDLINKKIDEIYKGKSNINPYGATSQTEFFAVASEYFFERPKLLKQKHPELYKLLEKIFKQSMISRGLNKQKVIIGRNSKCPCNSGKKFKHCCGSVHE